MNGQCGRERMTLHLGVKTFCTLLPPAIITPLTHILHRFISMIYFLIYFALHCLFLLGRGGGRYTPLNGRAGQFTSPHS